MRRELQWLDGHRQRVVHVAGVVTEEVASFLGPATHALARAGLAQTVVLIDVPGHRQHLLGLHESAQLILTARMTSPLRQWLDIVRELRRTLAPGLVHAVHFHGLIPCLVGACLVRRLQVAVFYSPHGSRSLGTLRRLGAVALYAVRAMLRSSPRTAIVNMPEETHAIGDWQAVDLVESPVSEAFFGVRRNEARHPLIVSGGSVQSIRSAELVAQLAVLLSGEDLRISFNWVGPIDEISRTRLNAANVGVFDSRNDIDVGARFGAGWIFFAPGGTRGFPISLVEAMATGLPCVAMNSVQHRQVLQDGETGFLCDSQREMITRIATLIDSPQLRASMGQAARNAARHRFSISQFNERLLAAYSLAE